MAQGFWNWLKTAASNATADSSINWAEGMPPSAVNDSARAMMARLAEWRDDISGTITTGGTSTAFTVTSNQVFDSLAHMNGAMIAFVPHATNGATVTLNVDGLGAKPLRSAPSVELPAGVLVLGTPCVATYNNSDAAFYLQNLYVLPSGTTAQRPSPPAASNMRFNTTTAAFEVYNGTFWTSLKGVPTVQVLTSGTAATYTTATGATWLRIRVMAGGGGGGGGGTAGSPGGDAGAGGASSFNSVTAGGGAAGTGGGGSGVGLGGAGGTGGTGTATLRFSGTPGSIGFAINSVAQGGIGGASPFGGAGVCQGATATAGKANTGSGGGGGPSQSVSSAGGGGGGAGEYYELIIANPSGTYTYTVGAAGTAGAAGNGAAGGAGAAGIIIVEEHYD